MTWANAALLSASVMAFVSILDSHLVSKRFPSMRSFILPLALINLAYGLIMRLAFPLPAGVDMSLVGVAVLSACLRTGAVVIMFDSLRHREVSSVVPVVYAYPMFVALLAVIFLGERLTWLQWAAVGIVASGAVMISLGRELSRSDVGRPRAALLFLSSLLLAAADVTSKQALSQLTFWNLFWVQASVMGGIFLLYSLRRSVLAEIGALADRWRALKVLALNETIAPVGIILAYWAMAHGPVSLVSALLGSRPLLVLLFALALSRRAPDFLFWNKGRRLLITRAVATAMIVVGVAIIKMSG